MKRYIRSSDKYDMEPWKDPHLEYVSNVNGYQVYRKIVDGRGKWFAHYQDDPIEYMFPITYDQARGFADLPARSPVEKLGRHLGKQLLPVNSSTVLNEDEFEYLIAKIQNELETIFPDYDVDDINWDRNRIGFGLYDDHGNEYGHYIFSYRPDYDDGPEEQLDNWLDANFG